MKKILVTGANGYIGRYVTKTLLENEYEVIAADVHFDNVDGRATYFRDSIFDIKENLYVELGQPDVCIHLAWQDGFVHNAPSHMEKLSQHYRFLKDLGEQGCKNITVMGSMHEIGYWEGAIEAETPCNPLSLYRSEERRVGKECRY